MARSQATKPSHPPGGAGRGSTGGTTGVTTGVIGTIGATACAPATICSTGRLPGHWVATMSLWRLYARGVPRFASIHLTTATLEASCSGLRRAWLFPPSSCSTPTDSRFSSKAPACQAQSLRSAYWWTPPSILIERCAERGLASEAFAKVASVPASVPSSEWKTMSYPALRS